MLARGRKRALRASSLLVKVVRSAAIFFEQLLGRLAIVRTALLRSVALTTLEELRKLFDAVEHTGSYAKGSDAPCFAGAE
jgi:hypothetical protein